MLATLLGMATLTSNLTQAKEVEGFWSVSMKIDLSGSVGRQESRLYLFKGGVAVTGMHQEGIDSLDLAKIKATRNDTNYGTWTKTGSKLRIRWGGGTNPQTFTQQGANWVGDETFRPLKRVDGLKMNGIFAREELKWDGAQLMLRPDGTFVFRNAHRVNFVDLSKVAPNDGGGSYSIQNWTLYLKYNNGQTATMSFELPHTQEAAKAEFVTIASQNFYRFSGTLTLPAGTEGPPMVPTKIGSLNLSVPADWTRQDHAQVGLTVLMPPGIPPGRLCAVSFTTPEPFAGDERAHHEGTWKAITQGLKMFEGKPGGEKVGPFLRSWGKLRRDDSSFLGLSLYTYVADGKGVAVMYAADIEQIFDKHFGACDGMMRTAKRG
ncbi:MAG TPA: hypothetical protein VM328_08195 [Fimbriimonadaceae bacterium]|nr:hypothetical protein [Fimbriimonadaceae bacterium]